MSRATTGPAVSDWYVPRMSGDEPNQIFKMLCGTKCSPCERG